jgi:sulfur relay protein TusB/DsrH
MTLHIIQHSRSERPNFDTCTAVAASGDALILIQNGVLEACKVHDSLPQEVEFWVLEDDLAGRGMESRLQSPFKPLSYDGFVELCTRHKPVHTWR